MSRNPAFPCSIPSNGGTYHYAGLSQQTYIATKVLQGFCSNPAIFAKNGMTGWDLVNCTNEQLVSLCYSLADAMIAMENTMKEKATD